MNLFSSQKIQCLLEAGKKRRKNSNTTPSRAVSSLLSFFLQIPTSTMFVSERGEIHGFFWRLYSVLLPRLYYPLLGATDYLEMSLDHASHWFSPRGQSGKPLVGCWKESISVYHNCYMITQEVEASSQDSQTCGFFMDFLSLKEVLGDSAIDIKDGHLSCPCQHIIQLSKMSFLVFVS